MLLFLRGRSERKRRLFACACCRRIWRLLDSNHRMAVEIAEKFADGLADEEERSAVAYLVDGADEEVEYEELESPRRLGEVASSWAVQSDQECTEEGVLDPDTEDCAILAAQSAAKAVRAKKREAAAQCQLLRDIFGNPFRKGLEIKQAWRTDTVVALARQMYDACDFSAMPVLADALEDAGCDSDDILNHCRGSDAHVRGCWVVDALTERS
jgi:hypothetical protein